MAETAAQRFDRDYGHVPEVDRVNRELNHQTLERLQRIYVAPDGSTPADNNHIS